MQHLEIVINEQYAGFNPVQFGYEDCEPLHSFGPAVRDHWLLHYVKEGKGILKREGKEYTVRAGEIFVIPPFLETYYEADGKTPWKYIWIGFTGDEQLMSAFNTPVIRCPDAGEIFESMRRCHRLQGGKSAFLSSRIWKLFSAVLERNQTDADYLEKALYYMQSEYMNDIRVADLAKRLNLDRCYFSTMFTRRMGVSPSQYLIDLRLEKAAELMREYGKTPSIAAVSVGYSDIYAFSKSFKKKFGCSPRGYIAQETTLRKA